MVDKINQQQMSADYGFAMSFLRSDDELWQLFNKAVKNTWDPNRFVAGLRNTKWFQKHSASVRNAIMQETSDPATYEANVNQMAATVRDSWGAMFGASAKGMLGDQQLRTWAETAHRMGWSEAQLMDRMAGSINYSKMLKRDKLGGRAAEVAGQIDALGEQFGVDLGRKWKARQLERLMKGDDTIGATQQRVRDRAIHEYKAFADRIAGGETVLDIADPYIQRMADLLEVNPDDVGLKSNLIQRALKQQTPEGKPAAMDLTTFADLVRKDKRWQHTDNAREQVNEVTAGLLRDFGLIAG